VQVLLGHSSIATAERYVAVDDSEIRAAMVAATVITMTGMQRMLGHTSAKMTLDTYADLFDDDLDAVAVHSACPVFTGKCAQNVLTGCSRRSAANIKPSTCANMSTASVRAEGLEPSRSLEHRHLKPACKPIPPRPRPADRTASLAHDIVGGAA
jgi:hypothetical protein